MQEKEVMTILLFFATAVSIRLGVTLWDRRRRNRCPSGEGHSWVSEGVKYSSCSPDSSEMWVATEVCELCGVDRCHTTADVHKALEMVMRYDGVGRQCALKLIHKWRTNKR